MSSFPSGQTVKTVDGLTWFYRQFGSGPHLVLIPSGNGDCDVFEKTALQISQDFTVTVFDMPGMSRSIPVPSDALADLTAQKLAIQVMNLMDALKIQLATYYGCSSGGATALAIQGLFPGRVRNAIVHEVPLGVKMRQLEAKHAILGMQASGQLNSETLGKFLHKVLGQNEKGSDQASDDFSIEYQDRNVKNTVLWADKYLPGISDSITDFVKDRGNLSKKPIDWTIGAFNPAGMFFENALVATSTDIPLSLLPAGHVPHLTIPDALAAHIRTKTQKYL